VDNLEPHNLPPDQPSPHLAEVTPIKPLVSNNQAPATQPDQSPPVITNQDTPYTSLDVRNVPGIGARGNAGAAQRLGRGKVTFIAIAILVVAVGGYLIDHQLSSHKVATTSSHVTSSSPTKSPTSTTNSSSQTANPVNNPINNGGSINSQVQYCSNPINAETVC
jgi:hypothetical protein